MKKLFLTAAVLLVPSMALAMSFSDVPDSHPNATAIKYLKDAGIVSGNPDGTYKPDEAITRAAFTKIVIGSQYDMVEIDACLGSNPLSFLDVSTKDWFAKYVCLAVLNLIIEGYGDNTFRPGSNINMAEAAKILALVFDLPLGEGGEWYEPYIDALSSHEALPDSYQGPGQVVTRGAMAEMIYRLMNPGMMHDDMMHEEEMMDEEKEMLDEEKEMTDEEKKQMQEEEMKEELNEQQAETKGTYTAYSTEVMGNGQTSILFFHAPWCPSCVSTDEFLTKLTGNESIPVSVYKVDYDTASDELKQKYGIVQQHTFVKIDGNGNAIATEVGLSDEKLQALINEG